MSSVTVHLAHVDARVPMRATAGAAGYDLCSCETAVIAPGARRLVDTGVRMEFDGTAMYARIAPRSGLAVRGIDAMAGVCDADYRGTYRVLLANSSDAEFVVRPGDRIAQVVFESLVHPYMVVVPTATGLEPTARGSAGFGSSGIASGPIDGKK